MFTGLIQARGKVSDRTETQLAITITDRADIWPDPIALGESVAINGVCLTVVSDMDHELRFDISPETWNRTGLGGLQRGGIVNVERAMRASDRFGGHIVQGHVDAVGEVLGLRAEGEFVVFTVRVPKDGGKYLIDKGSISVDGVSLTVVSPTADTFDVWLIPHTIAATNLEFRGPGDKVNLEYDAIAKHVERLLQYRHA